MDDHAQNQFVTIAGVKVSNYSLHELLEAIEWYVKTDHPALMLSANVHSINLANKHPWFMKLINSAEIVRNDSAGVLLAGKILRSPVKARLTWADFGWLLAEFCERKKLTLFFLGNNPGIPEKARDNLKRKHPELMVAGTHHGYFKKWDEENENIIQMINRCSPDILIIGLGMPLQEKWILENKEKLKAGIIMTGGNCFTYLAGLEQRAPKWMYKNGMEWLYRFLKEPFRMFSRYIIGNPLFLYRIILQRLGK
ncbi:MAG: WecB/TagA/CpsF family glycosyltransferase [Balneolales bacterium]